MSWEGVNKWRLEHHTFDFCEIGKHSQLQGLALDSLIPVCINLQSHTPNIWGCMFTLTQT